MLFTYTPTSSVSFPFVRHPYQLLILPVFLVLVILEVVE